MKIGELPHLSIIVPCYQEAENIPLLASEIHSVLCAAIPKWEMVIVDDDSRDGTQEVCMALQRQGFPLHLVVRQGQRGLATAVLEGFRYAGAPVFLVMDADLSHRPSEISSFYQAIQQGAEFAIGSRYMPGGGTDDLWTIFRFFNSKIATLLTRPLVSLSDPMSGFFCMPASLWHQYRNLSPVGYKIALEILIKCRPRNIVEIPIRFRTRRIGRSKLNIKQQALYLQHLYRLYKYAWS